MVHIEHIMKTCSPYPISILVNEKKNVKKFAALSKICYGISTQFTWEHSEVFIIYADSTYYIELYI